MKIPIATGHEHEPDHVQKFRLTRKGHLCAFAWIQGNAARWRVEFEHIFFKSFSMCGIVFGRLGWATTAKTPKIKFSSKLNGRLALEDGSDRRETLGKRVSDDLEHFIFQRRKIFFGKIFR